jgi:FkbM family methyltransferase
MLVRRGMRRLLPPPLALAIRREILVRRVAGERGHREDDIDLLPQFVRRSDICWDIGANSGTYTLPLSRLSAKVLAFEPVPHSFDIVERVTKRARLANVTLSRLALSDSTGTAKMLVPTEGFYGGYYLASLSQDGNLPVSTATIDGLIADGFPEPDFIKCDVEGAELRVIEGAKQLIARRPPVWLLETFDEEPLQVVQQLGYAVYINLNDGRRLGRVRERNVTRRNYWLLPDSDTLGDTIDGLAN